MTPLNRYKTNNNSVLDIFMTFEVILTKTQHKLQEAQKSISTFDDLACVKASSEAAFNLALIVHAMDSDSIDGDPQHLMAIKKSCLLFVEMIVRANVNKNGDLFGKLIHELDSFKKVWRHVQENQQSVHPAWQKNSVVAGV